MRGVGGGCREASDDGVYVAALVGINHPSYISSYSQSVNTSASPFSINRKDYPGVNSRWWGLGNGWASRKRSQ